MDHSATRLNLSAAIASVVVALILIGLKLWALSVTGSLAIAAALADSALDFLVSASGLAAVAYAARPPDQDHAFGHSSVEDLAALAQALFLMGVSGGLVVMAVRRFLSPDPVTLGSEGLGMAVMAVSIVLTLALIAWQRHVAGRTGNRVIMADSLHYVGDLLPNIGAIVALWASARFGVIGVDSLVALIAAGVLAIGALRILSGAWHALMDRHADADLIAEIEAIIDGFPGILGHHDMRTRTSGSRVFLDFHVEIDGTLSLREAHEIAAQLKRRILKTHPQVDILIHKDPKA